MHLHTLYSDGTMEVQALLDHWAMHYGVNVHLVRGLAWMESGYNNRLVSSTGARGIMQIEPYTWRFVEDVLIGHRVPHGPNGNIHVGVAYLRAESLLTPPGPWARQRPAENVTQAVQH